MPLRERAVGLLGIDLGVVDDPQRDRVHPQLLRQFVHRDLEHHQPRCLAGRAHRIAFGQVHRRQTHVRHPVGTRIEQPGLHDRGLGPAAGKVAAGAFMRDRGQLPVAGRAQPNALDRRGPMGGVVDHHRPRQRDLDRPPRRLRPQRREHRIGAEEQLPAKTAADIGRVDPDVLRRHAQRDRQIALRPGDHLVRGPHRQFVTVPRGDARERFHHRMAFVRGGVDRVERHRRGGERALEIPHPVDLGRGFAVAATLDRSGRRERGQIVAALLAHIVHADRAGGGAGLFERIGDDQRDRLVIMLDHGATEQRRGIHPAERQFRHVERRHDRDHAGHRLRLGQIHTRDPALRDRRAEDEAIGLIGSDVVAFIRIGRGARGLELAVDAVVRLADDLQLVDRVLPGGGVELHGISPSLRPRWRRASARPTRP